MFRKSLVLGGLQNKRKRRFFLRQRTFLPYIKGILKNGHRPQHTTGTHTMKNKTQTSPVNHIAMLEETLETLESYLASNNCGEQYAVRVMAPTEADEDPYYLYPIDGAYRSVLRSGQLGENIQWTNLRQAKTDIDRLRMQYKGGIVSRKQLLSKKVETVKQLLKVMRGQA